MSTGVVYFVDDANDVWHCIPRLEVRRVRLQHVLGGDVGVFVCVLMSFGVDVPVRLADSPYGAVSDQDGHDVAKAILASLTASVDVDITWTRTPGRPGVWLRAESRPE